VSADDIFLFCNYAVLPAWLLLAVLPHHKITQTLIHAIWIPCLLAPVYIWALFFGPPPIEGAGMGSLAGVMLLFQSPMALLGGWIHYLVFDLFIGAWIVRDARRLGINHWLTLPCLLATLMAGPAGLLLYLLLRVAMTQKTSLYETPA
jgi:hypothetical protein